MTQMEKVKIKNVTWHIDVYGDYWVAHYAESGGLVGTFYNLEPNGKRKSREDQQADLEHWYEVV